MKKTKIILCILLAFCFIACDNEDFDTPVGTLMSRESAYNRIKKDIKHSLKDVDIWASKKPIPANTTIVYGPNSFLSPDTEAWCFFVDEQPTADWDHDCQYILVDAKHQIHTMDKQLEPNNLYEDYDLINISDIRKNIRERRVIPSVENLSKSRALQTNNKYAIILSGGKNKENNHIRYWNNCSYIYNILTKQYGYSSDNIHVLMADGTDPAIDNTINKSSELDLDNDGIDDIDHPATISSLRNVINTLSSQLTNEDYLFIYVTDHGTITEISKESAIFMWDQDLLFASIFADMLDAINAKAINIVMGQCKSGGFVEYLNTKENLCISTSCGKEENTYATSDTIYTEYLYNWTKSHELNSAGDYNGDGFVSALESHGHAVNQNSFENQTPQHYSDGYLSRRLSLSGIFHNTYSTYFDGYCVFNYNTNNKYSFYADEPNHEPEFGIATGDKIDITLTQPHIYENIFAWSIVENNNYTTVFTPNNTRAHLEVRNQSPIGQRIRVKVEANIPEDNYYLAQYLNFYITSNYRIARSGNDVLSIENTNTDNTSTTYTLNASAAFDYQIVDEGTDNVRMSGSYPKNQKLDLNISQLSSGVYTLIIRENGEIKANQRLTI